MKDQRSGESPNPNDSGLSDSQRFRISLSTTLATPFETAKTKVKENCKNLSCPFASDHTYFVAATMLTSGGGCPVPNPCCMAFHAAEWKTLMQTQDTSMTINSKYSVEIHLQSSIECSYLLRIVTASSASSTPAISAAKIPVWSH
eukprot:2207879-Amphidinium_carterae.1